MIRGVGWTLFDNSIHLKVLKVVLWSDTFLVRDITRLAVAKEHCAPVTIQSWMESWKFAHAEAWKENEATKLK